MPGSERRRDIFIASGAGFGWTDPAVGLDDGFLEGGQSLTPGMRQRPWITMDVAIFLPVSSGFTPSRVATKGAIEGKPGLSRRSRTLIATAARGRAFVKTSGRVTMKPREAANE